MPKADAEKYEWTDMWWDDADADDILPRVLLVGDSITRGYHLETTWALEGVAHVSVYATSKCIDNPFYREELYHVIKAYGFKYDLIHFNNGLHGRDTTEREFIASYRRICEELMVNLSDSKFTIATSTPCLEHSGWKEIAEERNALVLEFAKEKNISVDDLYCKMLPHPELHVEDGIHFTPEGEKLQGQIVSDFIKSQLKL